MKYLAFGTPELLQARLDLAADITRDLDDSMSPEDREHLAGVRQRALDAASRHIRTMRERGEA